MTDQYKDLDPGVTLAKFSAPSSAGVTLSGMASTESVPTRLEAASSSVPASFDWTAIAKRAAKSPGYAVQLLNLVGRPEQPVRRRPAIVPTASAVAEDAEIAPPELATAIAVPVAEKGLIESGVSPARSEVVNGVETAVNQGI
ncbi:MAG: hypothetical protein K2Q25_10365 [Mycobacteriaceae bacterium]|nr:hypothetical protein [Mycobacteriaceae bacterium]